MRTMMGLLAAGALMLPVQAGAFERVEASFYQVSGLETYFEPGTPANQHLRLIGNGEVSVDGKEPSPPDTQVEMSFPVSAGPTSEAAAAWGSTSQARICYEYVRTMMEDQLGYVLTISASRIKTQNGIEERSQSGDEAVLKLTIKNTSLDAISCRLDVASPDDEQAEADGAIKNAAAQTR
jgi:hypothetical protein